MKNAWTEKIETQEKLINAFAERLVIVQLIFNKYKHLDNLLSDKAWINGDDSSPLRSCAFDLWQAIRIACRPDMTEGLNFWEAGFLECPDCNGIKFARGPAGGLSVNFKCAECGSEFNNMGPFGTERI